MILKAAPVCKYDERVKMLQRKLNTIRYNVHGNWPYLQEDGFFGKQTTQAVKGFQIYKYITPASGEAGSLTLWYIEQTLNSFVCIRNANPATKIFKPKEPVKVTELLKNIGETAVSFVDELSSVIENEIGSWEKLGRLDKNLLKSHVLSLTSRWNPTMKKFRNLLQSKIHAEASAKSYESLAKVQSHQIAPKDTASAFKVRNAHRMTSYYNSSARISSIAARSSSSKFIENLKKYNLMEKIDRQLQKIGLSRDVEVKIGTKANFKFKLDAGKYFKVWSFKDVIWDLLQFHKYGTHEWWEDLKKDFYSLIDGIIIGFAASIAAAGITALIVGTSATGGVAVLVAVLAMVISGILSYLLSAAEVSLTETMLEGWKYIFSYSWMLLS